MNNFFTQENWEFFLNTFPNIGSFKIDYINKIAFLDKNACKLLSIDCDKLSLETDINFLENIIKSITNEKYEYEQNIYKYTINNKNYWLNININKNEFLLIGFLKDVTSQIADKNPSINYEDFDPRFHLMYRDSFIKYINNNFIDKTNFGCMAALHVIGTENTNYVLNYTQNNRCTLSIIETLKKFETKDIIIGLNSQKEFYVYFNIQNKVIITEILKNMISSIEKCKITDEFGQIINSSEEYNLGLKVGYSFYPDDAMTLSKLINRAEYALFEIFTDQNERIRKFSIDSYSKNRENFLQVQKFSKLVDENLFNYHFQPIVDASTGNIFAYEALMRSSQNISMNPTQILEIAKDQNRLYDIEKITFFNTLKILSLNQEKFQNKKLFINSIPHTLLNQDDFDFLKNTYGELFEKIVVELIELSERDDNLTTKIRDRYAHVNSELAIDDYGSGFSNSSNLLSCMPNYLKIDRSLITNIDKDIRKQQLVGDIIKFSSKNYIKTLAEGVETAEELKVVINLGVDFVQGFFTSMPKPVILNEISEEIRQLILQINLEKDPEIEHKKVYKTVYNDHVNLLNLYLNKFTDIIIQTTETTLYGNKTNQTKLNISIPDHFECSLYLKDINIRGVEAPSISIGKGSKVTLILEGDNYLSYEGIYVPQNSTLKICGDGNLYIDCDHNNSVGIGSNYEYHFGNIIIDLKGNLKIVSNGDHTIGIGGGTSSTLSLIHILSGNIDISVSGIDALGIGSLNGNTEVKLENSDISISVNALHAVAIGCFNDKIKINSYSKIKIHCLGTHVAAIGSIYESNLTCNFFNSSVDIVLKAKDGVSIGEYQGSFETNIINSNINIESEGTNIIGIGNSKGYGNIDIVDSNIQYSILSANRLDIGSKSGYRNISNSKINNEFIL